MTRYMAIPGSVCCTSVSSSSNMPYGNSGAGRGILTEWKAAHNCEYVFLLYSTTHAGMYAVGLYSCPAGWTASEKTRNRTPVMLHPCG